ncbi:hypothetical protein PR003_g33159, partial [Phytophthora rubi]
FTSWIDLAAARVRRHYGIQSANLSEIDLIRRAESARNQLLPLKALGIDRNCSMSRD